MITSPFCSLIATRTSMLHLQAGGIVLVFALSILVARVMGTTELSIYNTTVFGYYFIGCAYTAEVADKARALGSLLDVIW